VTRWVAESIGGQPVLPGATLDAEFGAEGRLTGTAGCNRYGAAYTRDGERISIAPAIATRMYCAQPAGVMEQEAAYLAALERAASAIVSDGRLTLADAAGAELVSFTGAA
jgi:heat shock protein HslJ